MNQINPGADTQTVMQRLRAVYFTNKRGKYKSPAIQEMTAIKCKLMSHG